MTLADSTALCVLAITASLWIPAGAPAPLQVKTSTGVVQGTAEPSGVRAFRGIPYAAPPVGNLRWQPPQSAKAWTGVRAADRFGPRCMQRGLFSDMVFRSNGMSEDCLYLNIWTPPVNGNERLPVLVYFYGGGFLAGDGSEPRYDGEAMARKGIVALTVNYRLNVFGFLAHPWPPMNDGATGQRDGSQAPATGAAHSAEIEYAMGNLASNKVFAWTADDQKVSEVFQAIFEFREERRSERRWTAGVVPGQPGSGASHAPRRRVAARSRSA